MRAQLQSGNLLTGQLMVNLVFVADTPKATLSSRNGFKVIPTIPGSFDRLQESVSRIIANLEKVKFDQIGSELQQTLKEVKNTVAEIGGLAKRLNGETAPKLQATLADLQKTLAEMQKGFGTDSALNYNATKAVEELSLTLRSLRELLTTLDNQPQSLIFGKENKSSE